jgi:hypothetical protein
MDIEKLIDMQKLRGRGFIDVKQYYNTQVVPYLVEASQSQDVKMMLLDPNSFQKQSFLKMMHQASPQLSYEFMNNHKNAEDCFKGTPAEEDLKELTMISAVHMYIEQVFALQHLHNRTESAAIAVKKLDIAHKDISYKIGLLGDGQIECSALIWKGEINLQWKGDYGSRRLIAHEGQYADQSKMLEFAEAVSGIYQARLLSCNHLMHCSKFAYGNIMQEIIIGTLATRYGVNRPDPNGRFKRTRSALSSLLKDLNTRHINSFYEREYKMLKSYDNPNNPIGVRSNSLLEKAMKL